MNEVLKNLWSQITAASGPVKVALASCGAVIALVTAVFVWRAQNPHFVVLETGLDSHSFSSAVRSLAEAGIRYESSSGGAPYTILVDSAKIHEARFAMHSTGQFMTTERGISSALAGGSSVFLGQAERAQRTQKRMWEEAEMQLEAMNIVAKAKVTISGAPSSTLASLREDQRRAAVTITLRGAASPTPTETRAMVGVVRGATNVSDDRITIVDQHAQVLFDGLENSSSDSWLDRQEQYARTNTERVQRYLDQVYGPGLTVVGVSAEWTRVQEESVSEQLTPAKKPRSSRSRTSEEPVFPRSIGGPAGVAANTSDGDNSATSNQVNARTSTTSEEELLNSFGSTTTHTVKQPHQLERISVSLTLDKSIEDQMTVAIKQVKGLLNFNEERGDQLLDGVAQIHSLERDAEGAPVLPGPDKAPPPTNPILAMAMEFGLELIAGIAFLVVLLRSLKSARTSVITPKRAAGGAGGGATGGAGRAGVGAASLDGAGGEALDEEVDLDALARAHIEELLREEPEKVSALLSRWAMSEELLAEAGGR